MTQLKHNAATRVSHYANATGGCPDGRKTGKRYDKGVRRSAECELSKYMAVHPCAAKGTRGD